LANVQKYLDQFNTTIKLARFDENQTLREKRDIIRRKLNDRLPGVFENHDEVCPSFDFCDQGSYKMGTGVRPLEGAQFDIDQGMYFAISSEDYPDPVLLKQRVHEALDGHTDSVRIRTSCVTVFYHQDEEQIYHVDLAIYADGTQEPDDKPRLAKGKENSNDENRFWEISKPQELADVVLNWFSDEDDRKQFRRLVRYLKRWRDERFNEGGNSAPVGLALTILVLKNLSPKYGFDGKPDDLGALSAVVNAILAQFVQSWDPDNGEWTDRLKVELPVEPWSDLLEKMTNRQMTSFKEKLESLRDSLKSAQDQVDPREACIVLNRQFGRDFPIPDPEDTAKKHAPAIVSSSSSA
jgi:hypothetical protein